MSGGSGSATSRIYKSLVGNRSDIMRPIRESHSTVYSSARSVKRTCSGGNHVTHLPGVLPRPSWRSVVNMLFVMMLFIARTATDDYLSTTGSDIDDTGYQGNGVTVVNSPNKPNSSTEYDYMEFVDEEKLAARRDYVAEIVADSTGAVPRDGNRRSVVQHDDARLMKTDVSTSACSPSPVTLTPPTKTTDSGDTESPASDTKTFVISVDKIRSVRLWHGLEVSQRCLVRLTIIVATNFGFTR